MISTQVLTNCIEELRSISKVNLAVFGLDGGEVASTFDSSDISSDMIRGFVDSPADSQVIGFDHLLKIMDEGELIYILVARGSNDEVYLIGKIAVSQIQQLITAYKERFDRNNFFQTLLMDNLLLVDMYNRAKKLHIEVMGPRVVYIVETRAEKDNTAAEFLKGMFSAQSGDFITAIDESNVILIKSLEASDKEPDTETILTFDLSGFTTVVAKALKEVANGDANKVFIPFDATSALGSLGAIKEVMKDDKK